MSKSDVNPHHVLRARKWGFSHRIRQGDDEPVLSGPVTLKRKPRDWQCYWLGRTETQPRKKLAFGLPAGFPPMSKSSPSWKKDGAEALQTPRGLRHSPPPVTNC